MPLSLVGTLPVSAINLGVAAAPPVLAAKLADLQADLTKLTVEVPGYQAELAASPPAFDPASFALAKADLALSLPATLGDPLSWVTLGADINTELAGQLGTVAANVAITGAVEASFVAGLSAGSLASWVYSGPCAGLGEKMRPVSRWGAVAPGSTVSGLVIATESQVSWKAFGQGFNIGDTGADPASPSVARLTFLGQLSADKLNTGVASLKQAIDQYLFSLKAAQLALEAQIKLSLGVNLPDPGALVAALAVQTPDIVLPGAAFTLDFAPQIAGLQASITALLKLSADLSAQLSAGGLSVWQYQGPVEEWGPSFAATFAGGLPGGHGAGAPIYAAALATELPEVWAAWGAIFAIGG